MARTSSNLTTRLFELTTTDDYLVQRSVFIGGVMLGVGGAYERNRL